jgi:hypothetical protein
MILTIDVEASGDTHRLDVDLATIEAADVPQIAALCGSEAIVAAANGGELGSGVVDAMMAVVVAKAIPGVIPGEILIDWGALAPHMTEDAAAVLESLAAASEDMS